MNQSNAYLDAIKFNDQGLLPAIAQDAVTKDVLMVAWMNRNAVAETLRTGEAHYFSRSRQTLWRKGEQSGHVQHVKEIRLDCDWRCATINRRSSRRHCLPHRQILLLF